EAESLYARRLAHGGPAAVEMNRAVARELARPSPDADSTLAKLVQRNDRVGNAAGYNLGTLEGARRDYDSSVALLLRVMEPDRLDQDARWNYEVLAKRRDEQRRRDQQQRPNPEQQNPSRPQPSGGGGNNPKPGAGTPPPQPPPPSPSGGPPPPTGG